jgi:hypothetical protein
MENHRTTRDALIHELLGDVGTLHDSIKAMPTHVQTHMEHSLSALGQSLQRETDSLTSVLTSIQTTTQQLIAFTATVPTLIQDTVNTHVHRLDTTLSELGQTQQKLSTLLGNLEHKAKEAIDASLASAAETAKIDICTSARETAVNIVKETLALHIRPGLKPIEEATRKLERCSHKASELIQKASPSSDIKLWERCLSIFLSSLAGSLLTLLVLGVLLKTGRLPVYQPVLPAEEIAKELSKELNKPKSMPKKYQPKK